MSHDSDGPNGDSDGYMDRLIAAIADGGTVDWAAAEAQVSNADERGLLEKLRIIAELRAACEPSTDRTTIANLAATREERHVAALARLSAQSRFVVQECLGQGGFGIVYRAHDRERSVDVALKAFTRPGIDSVYAFKREFRVLANVTHPNFVSLYELFGDDRSWFISMELVHGVDFLAYVRGAGPPSSVDTPSRSSAATPGCNLANLAAVLTQLCEAVAYLHREGLLHCDLKPSNVLVTNLGQVKVVDFGLTTDATHTLTDSGRGLRGTPAYVSPEQLTGSPPSAASDWYAVGVMLFEALTGERPFHGTVSEVLTAKQRQFAPPPATLSNWVPGDLNALCCRLLEQDPAARPSDADVLATLAAIWPEAASPKRRDSPPLRDHGPFVGRQSETAQLEEAFADVTRAERLHAAFVHGASGMGKSLLLRRFLETMQRQHPTMVVLDGRCSERESVPYKALDTLVDGLAQHLRTLPHDELQATLPGDVAMLARLFPILRRIDVVDRERRAAKTTDVQELRRRGGVALRDLLTRLAHRHRLLLAIDDLQWTDVDSSALLVELLFGPESPPLLFIGCYRTEEAGSNASLRTLLATADNARQQGRSGVTTIRLGELSRQEARELVGTLTRDEGLSPHIDAIVEESGRSPLFIHQLVHYSAMATTVGGPGAPIWQSDLGTRQLTLDSVIRARTASFGEGARRLLQVLAVFGEPLGLAFASDVAGIGPAVLSESVALRVAKLARSRIDGAEEKLEVYHDRIREAIVSDIPADELKDLHGRLASALEHSPDADPETLLHHFHKAGRHETAATYALVAGDRAADALAFERAARSYRFALDFGRFDDAGHAVRIKLGDALAATGRGYDAAQAYLEAATTATGDATIDLKRRASEQLLQSGHLDEGMRVVNDVLRHVGLKLPGTPRRALVSLLLLRARLQLRGLHFTEREERAVPKETLAAVDSCWSVTTGLAIVDHIRSAEFGARHLLVALDAGEPLRIVRALAMELAYTSISGAKSQPYNEKLIALASPLAERLPNPEARAMLILGRGSAAYMQGRWMASRELCEQATQILRGQCTRVAWQIDTAQFYTLLSLFYLGEIADLARRLPVLLKEAMERDALYSETILCTRLAHLTMLADDNVEGAERAIRQGMERWSQKGFYNQHYYEMVATAETALYAGRGADAWNGLMKRWDALAHTLLLRVQPVLIESVHLRGRAALAAAMDRHCSAIDRERLLRLAAKDASKIQRTAAPWAGGLAHLLLAGIHSVRDDPGALVHLAAAEATFEREQMGLYLAVARQRRGEVLGSVEGGALASSARAAMHAQSIRMPDAFARMLAPGRFVAPVTQGERGRSSTESTPA